MSKVTKAEKWAHKHAPDDILKLYVRVANEHAGDEAVMGVTLTVGGVVIAGDLISDRAWAAAAHQLAAAGGDDEPLGFAGWRDFFVQRQEKNAERTAILDEREDDAEPTDEQRIAHAETSPGFIHLRNAQVLQGVTMVPKDGNGLWRGRLSRVDGWFLGRLGTGQPSNG